jgi:aryl-alcohol dehydrogenase-like predicted oxidoreductase
VYGLLLHDAEDLLIPGGGRLVRRLTDIRERGTATKIGVSIYDGDQLNAVLERFQPDIVQLPLSILDQRLIRSGHLKRLKSLGVEIHARSLFLQGLMFMDLDHLDPFFKPISKSLSQLRLATQEQGLTPLAAALSFGLAQAELDRIVVGVCSLVELNQIIEAVATETTSMDFSRFAISNPTFVNPSLWRLQST